MFRNYFSVKNNLNDVSFFFSLFYFFPETKVQLGKQLISLSDFRHGKISFYFHFRKQNSCLKTYANIESPTKLAYPSSVQNLCCPLRKHDYSNIKKISHPKTENFQVKKLIFFKFLPKT